LKYLGSLHALTELSLCRCGLDLDRLLALAEALDHRRLRLVRLRLASNPVATGANRSALLGALAWAGLSRSMCLLLQRSLLDDWRPVEVAASALEGGIQAPVLACGLQHPNARIRQRTARQLTGLGTPAADHLGPLVRRSFEPAAKEAAQAALAS